MSERNDEAITRKSLLGAASITALCSLAGEVPLFAAAPRPMRSAPVRRAAVLWYSQAGNTRRYGECAARALSTRGIAATASDYRDFDAASLAGFDMIIIGSPVFAYLSEKTENIMEGKDFPFNFPKLLSDIVRGVRYLTAV